VFINLLSGGVTPASTPITLASVAGVHRVIT
jgi:hypothetical protein